MPFGGDVWKGVPFGPGLEGMDFVQAEKVLREFEEEISKGPEWERTQMG